jgi:hypothetical protein
MSSRFMRWVCNDFFVRWIMILGSQLIMKMKRTDGREVAGFWRD